MEINDVNRVYPHKWSVIEGGDLRCDYCGLYWPFSKDRPVGSCERTSEQLAEQAREDLKKFESAVLVRNNVRKKKPLTNYEEEKKE